MGRRLRAAPRAVPLAPLLSAEETRPRRRNRCHSRRAGVISRNSNSSGGEERKNWVLTIERAKGIKGGKLAKLNGWMDGTVNGNASTNFCLVGETENLDSSRSGRLHLRYGNGIAKAIVSHARAVVRVSPRKRMPVGMKFALWNED